MSGTGYPDKPAVALCRLHRFVSDQAPSGMAALCQHKLLGALEQTPLAPMAARSHPPTQLEWKAGLRRGRMALDVFTFNGETCLPQTVEPALVPWSPPASATLLICPVTLMSSVWCGDSNYLGWSPVSYPPSNRPSNRPSAEESYSAEVESWTTGEQLAGWILQSRYGQLRVGQRSRLTTDCCSHRMSPRDGYSSSVSRKKRF